MKPTTEILARISQNSLANKEEVFTNCIAICCVLTSTLWHTKTCMPTTVRQRKE